MLGSGAHHGLIRWNASVSVDKVMPAKRDGSYREGPLLIIRLKSLLRAENWSPMVEPPLVSAWRVVSESWFHRKSESGSVRCRIWLTIAGSMKSLVTNREVEAISG